jgi:hypothetical protein
LRLQNSSVRINTGLNSQGTYEHENDEGAWIDDDRFRSSNTRVTTIATSHAQNDSGMFEFNFRDERYLPFERAGVISDWQAEMTTDKELRQLDASTIADFILHIDYTAKSDAGLFKDKATDHVKEFLNNVADFNEQPLTQMFSMKYDFPTEWYRFLHPPVQGSDQVLNFIVGHERLPFFVQERDVAVMGLTVLASSSKDGDYNMTLTYTKPNADVVVSTETTTSTKPRYGDLKVLTLDTDDAGLALDELDIGAEMTLKLKRQVAPNYKGLSTDPDEIDDLLLAFHYKLIPVV